MPFQPIQQSQLGATVRSKLGVLGRTGGYSGNVIAGGSMFNYVGMPGAQSRVSRYNPLLNMWFPLDGLWPNDVNNVNGSVKGIAFYKDRLYIAGSFTNVRDQYGVNHACSRIASYSFANDNWDFLDGGVTTGSPTINDLCIYGGLLFACGRFNNAGSSLAGLAGVAAWDGTAWQNVGNPTGSTITTLNVLREVGGSLYVGASVSSGGCYIGLYAGGSWTKVTFAPAASNSGSVYTIFSHGGQGYAMGGAIFNFPSWFSGRLSGSNLTDLRVGILGGTSSYPSWGHSALGKMLTLHIGLPGYEGGRYYDPTNNTPPSIDGKLLAWPTTSGIPATSTIDNRSNNVIIDYEDGVIVCGGTKNPGAVSGIAKYNGSGNWVKLGTTETTNSTNIAYVIP